MYRKRGNIGAVDVGGTHVFPRASSVRGCKNVSGDDAGIRNLRIGGIDRQRVDKDRGVKPLFTAAQLRPPSILLNTPRRLYRCREFAGCCAPPQSL